MGVDLQTYRGRIGTFKFALGLDVVIIECLVNFSRGMKTVGAVLFVGLLLLMAGIESNPGPRDWVLPTDVTLSENAKNDKDTVTTESCPTGEVTLHPPNRKILDQLQLLDRINHKISIIEAISIDTVTKEQHTFSDLPWILLNQIISVHSNARDEILTNVSTPTSACTSSHTTVEKAGRRSGKRQTGSDTISPIDIFFAVFQCCDPFLKQLLFKKIYLCKKAIPFMYIDFLTSEPVVSIWPLRSFSLDHRITSNQEKGSDKITITCKDTVLDMKSRIIAFARFGRPAFSKSKLTNYLLNDNGNNTFYNYECKSGTTERHISKGCVEIVWLPTTGRENERFSDTLSLLNLRGGLGTDFDDTKTSYVSKISDILVVCVDVGDLKIKKDTVGHILGQFKTVVMIVSNSMLRLSAEEVDTYIDDMCREHQTHGGDINVLYTFEEDHTPINLDVLAADLIEIIKECSPNTPISLSERIQRLSEDSVIQTDEHSTDCVTGKELAEIVVKEMSHMLKLDRANNVLSPSDWKACLLPASCSLSNQVANVVKRLHQHLPSIEADRSRQELRSLRLKQVQSMSETIRKFIDILIENSKSEHCLMYALEWLKLFLDQQTKHFRQDLSSVIKQKQKLIKKYTKQNMPESDKKQLSSLENRIENASLGIEHFFREVDHIYDAVVELKSIGVSDFGIELPSKDRLVDVIANIILSGGSMEVIDGDHFYMTKEWIRLVLLKVNERIGSGKIMRLSVLGLQSSGKSTLLNTMFGIHFSVSSGRCTRGIHAQLIPIRQRENQVSAFQYIMVIDSEGLRAPELKDITGSTIRDNALATFVTGIADITMINIMGENFEVINDILQIVSHALLRLRLANHNVKTDQICLFIHHNVNDPNAKENMVGGISNVLGILDKVTEQAAKLEGSVDVRQFNDVITFDPYKHVYVLPSLWHGEVPMNTVSIGYNKDVTKLRQYLLQNVTDADSRSYRSLNDFLLQTSDLWKGVLCQDFVFSFRNSLEIIALNALNTKVGTLLRDLETFVRKELLINLQSEFLNCSDSSKSDEVRDNVIKAAKQKLYNKKEELKESLESIFTAEKEYKEFFKHWYTHSFQRLNDHCRELESYIQVETEKYHCLRSNEIRLSSVTADDKRILHQKSLDLVKRLAVTSLTQSQIDIEFEKEWKLHEEKVIFRNVKATDLEPSFLKWLNNTFENNKRDLHDVLPIGKGLREIKSTNVSFSETGITAADIGNSNTTPLEKIKRMTDVLLDTVKVSITSLSCSVGSKDIAELDVVEFLHTMREETERTINLAYDIGFICKISFQSKLFVSVCVYALQKFELHNAENGTKGWTSKAMSEFKEKIRSYFDKEIEDRKKEDHDRKENERIARENEQRKQQLIKEKREREIKERQRIQAEQERENQLKERENQLKKKTHYFCTDLKGHVKRIVDERLTVHLRGLLGKEFSDYSNKRNLIKDICVNLRYFDEFDAYLRNSSEYAKTWLSKKFDDSLFGYKDLYRTTQRQLIKDVMSEITSALNRCSTSLLGRQNFPPRQWLTGVGVFNISNFDTFVYSGDIPDVGSFTNMIKGELNSTALSNRIYYEMGIPSVTASSVRWNGGSPYSKLFDDMWGCKECCPFCQDPCRKCNNHYGNHECLQHRPKCCVGVHSISTHDAVFEVCNYSVSRSHTCTYTCGMNKYLCNPSKNSDCDALKHNYKDYKKWFPKWDIVDGDAYDTSKFWLRYTNKFKDALTKRYGINMTGIPHSWSYITDQEAKDSL